MVNVLGVSDTSRHAQATGGAHRFIVQAKASDLGWGLIQRGRKGTPERVRCGKGSDGRRRWKAEVLRDVCLSFFVSTGVPKGEKGK